MNTWVRRTAQAGVLAAGLVFAAAGTAAAAGPHLDTHDNYGIGNGNQVVAPIQVPVSICGNAVAAGGAATAGCEGGATAKLKGFDPELHSHANYGIGNGNQVVAPIQVPVDVSGNSGNLLGKSDAWSTGGSVAKITKKAPASKKMSGPTLETSENYGIGNGNQVVVPVQVPVSVCGNAVSAGGAATAACEGGATAKLFGSNIPSMKTWANYGIGVGNQVYVPVQVPVDVSGNAATLLGKADAMSKGGSLALLK